MRAIGQLAPRLSIVGASQPPYEGTGLQLPLPARLCGSNCRYNPDNGARGERYDESQIDSQSGSAQTPCKLETGEMRFNNHMDGNGVYQVLSRGLLR